jgi:hypothetical protein
VNSELGLGVFSGRLSCVAVPCRLVRPVLANCAPLKEMGKVKPETYPHKPEGGHPACLFKAFGKIPVIGAGARSGFRVS